MESYLKTQKFSGAEIVDLTGDHDISKSCFRISKELPTKLTTKFEIIEDDDDIKPSTASYHMSAEDVIQDEPIGRRYIRPLRPARHSMLHEETERDIPVFYIEDDEENEDDDDKIRELSPGEVEDLRTTLAHRSGSAHPTTGFGREDSVLRPFGIVVVPGMRVELQDGDFLAIKQLVRGKYGEAKVKGILLRRTRRIDNTLPKKYNELCAIIKASAENTGDPALDDYLVTREVSEIVAEREIIFTNQPFPACSWRVKDKMYRNEDELMEAAELVCRWKHVEFCNMIERGVSAKCWVRLREAESDAGMGLADIELMRAWHGDGDERVPASFKIRTAASTSHKTRTNPTNESLGARIDLTNGDSDSEIEEITEISTQTFVKRVNRQGVYERQSSSTTTERFTTGGTQSMSSKKSSPTSSTSRGISYGDICCGAGGATRAAERAGLNVMFVVDHDSDSCKTQRKNFAQAKVLKIDIFDFCTSTDRPWMRVTVLHISFPCQYYSAAHTINGQNDEKNVAAGYSVIPILKRCRPRVVTLEQTSNMVNGHPESFQALIQQFTECGYSVRAKIVNFADHGNVQPRKRLFIIAACPGEPLPHFPKPTHGNRPGLKKPTTIRDILNQVPVSIKPHMAESTPKNNKAPYMANQALRACITTSGGDGDLHPSGKRSFNLQELAQMGGFPARHKFVGNKTSIRRQIGNAVPATAATAFFEEVVKSVQQFDQEIAERRSEEIPKLTKKLKDLDIIEID